jgi:hypothetical protein
LQNATNVGEFPLHSYSDVRSSDAKYFTNSSSVLCAPLLAGLFLYFNVTRVMQMHIKPNNTEANAFNLRFSLIDNNPNFDNRIPFKYPPMNL